ncbi:hypothetical protein [Cognatiyoonia sp. IB215182]|uniref:hypothetical protein n=1 Tax=Cognatiyoonia sp. IB215182 TaxID=3097353 RepID=UPI002A147A13|nr:hypothetical protein [Cognatiyoonia sp. IB215182]MDX8354270.1 hypothetical protein [Cognatiyoonia sp. IB215182]
MNYVEFFGQAALCAFFLWASRIIQNWREDRVRPFLSDFQQNIFRRLRLTYFARHMDVILMLAYLMFSIDMLSQAIDNAIGPY